MRLLSAFWRWFTHGHDSLHPKTVARIRLMADEAYRVRELDMLAKGRAPEVEVKPEPPKLSDGPLGRYDVEVDRG